MFTSAGTVLAHLMYEVIAGCSAAEWRMLLGKALVWEAPQLQPHSGAEAVVGRGNAWLGLVGCSAWPRTVFKEWWCWVWRAESGVTQLCLWLLQAWGAQHHIWEWQHPVAVQPKGMYDCFNVVGSISGFDFSFLSKVR